MKALFTFLLILFTITFYKAQQVDWIKHVSYGGYSMVASIETDSLGNVYAVGQYSEPYYPNSYVQAYHHGFFLEKRDNNGTIIWQDTISCSGGVGQINLSRINNYLYLSGSASKKIDFKDVTLDYNFHRGVMAKYDLNGNVLWAYQDTLLAHEKSFYKNNILYVTGFSSENGKYYLAGYDNDGIQQWIRYGEQILDLTVLTDGNYITKVGNGASYDPDFIKKYDSNGNLLWAVSFPGYGYNITSDLKGNCYVSGGLISTSGYIGKLNSAGQWQWINYNFPNWVPYIYADPELDYIYTGVNDVNNKCWLNIYDTLGNYLRGVQIGDYTINLKGNCIKRYNKNIYVGGYDNCIGCNTGFVAKISDTSIPLSINEKQDENSSSLTIYPNPTQGFFQIEYVSLTKGMLQINITDANGKIVYTEAVSKFEVEFKTSVDLSRHTKGVYFIEINLGKKREVKKIVLE